MIEFLHQYGDQTELTLKLNVNKLLKELEPFNNKWSQYNENKPWINRHGLCVLNERGSVGPGPALNSLYEWNQVHRTNLKEVDFNKPTEVYKNSQQLQSILSDILPFCVRTHFLKLLPGGYFPPHRDHTGKEQKTFRLIVPIQACNPPATRFMIEDKTLHWNLGQMYLLNTTKQHMLFNATLSEESIWLVINCIVCDEMIDYIETVLMHK